MPRKRKGSYDDFVEIAIQINDIGVRSQASLNVDLKTSHPIFSHENDPAFEFESSLEISGECIYPGEFEHIRFFINLIGDACNRRTNITLNDCHAIDENKVPIYKEYRGKVYPVYNSPLGLSLLEKKRGENSYDTWAWVKPRMITDILILLSLNKSLYASMIVRKHNRKRWIEQLSIQTHDPAVE